MAAVTYLAGACCFISKFVGLQWRARDSRPANDSPEFLGALGDSALRWPTATAVQLNVTSFAQLECPPHTSSQYDHVDPKQVDAVFTHVDTDDAEWRRAFDKTVEKLRYDRADFRASDILARYRGWGELRFAMRSVDVYASWVRRIFLVVASPSQVPVWLDAYHKRITVVYHHELFDDPATQLPTFNALTVESVLYRIAGLSRHFIYFPTGAQRVDSWTAGSESCTALQILIFTPFSVLNHSQSQAYSSGARSRYKTSSRQVRMRTSRTSTFLPSLCRPCA